MRSNVDLSIVADTSKARAEFELLNAKVRELRKEVKAASDEANRSGGMTPRLAEATKELETAEAQQKAYTRATRSTSRANEEAQGTFAGLSREISGFARAAGLAQGHTKALRLGLLAMVGAEIIRGFNEITKKVTEIGEASAKIGVTTKTIQDLQQALGETGGKADDAAKILEKLTEPFLGERKKALDDYWAASKEGPEAATKSASGYAQAMQDLHIDVSRFGGDMKGQRDLALATAQALKNLADSGRVDEANRLSVELLGKNWREVGAAVTDFIRISQAAKGQGTGIASPEAQEAAKQYRIAISELGRAWDDFSARLTQSNIPKLLVNSLTGLIQIADGIIAVFGKVGDPIQAVWDKLTAFGTWLSDTFSSAVNTVATGFKDAWAATFDWLKTTLDQVMGWWDALIKKLDEAWQKTKEALGLGGPGGASPAPQAAPAMAAGGYVRGPGSATSDSIMARLSNGEYVMRAAAVSRWGPRFMAALNSLRNPFDGFADGGMVRTRGIPRFAGGGLVAAGGGATVNLVFPGGSFALQADNAVVGSLTREARRAGMLQGGRRAGLLQ